VGGREKRPFEGKSTDFPSTLSPVRLLHTDALYVSDSIYSSRTSLCEDKKYVNRLVISTHCCGAGGEEKCVSGEKDTFDVVLVDL
jgi:hypothetical protein